MSAVQEFQRIEHDSNTLPMAEIVRYLQEHLDRQVVAYIAGLKDAQMVADWIAGIAEPQLRRRLRLRYAYRAARMVVEAFDDSTAEAWLFGSNPKLDDEAPAWVLRNARTLDDLRHLIPAAKAFARSPE
jgi:hypothetical protein